MKTDVAVIGGGLAGILIACRLQERGIKTVVLEASRVGSGQTKNTTAKITLQHNIIYNKISKSFSEEKARQYANANQRAIEEYRRIISERNIECGFEERPAFLYSTDAKDIQRLNLECAAANKLGINAKFTTETKLPFPVAGAIRFEGQAQFNPLEFLREISKNLEIFENSSAIKVEKNRIITARGSVSAKAIVLATHYPFINFPGLFFARMHQERSYVVALENAAELDGMYLGIDSDALSFRNYKNFLLLGGGGHRTGKNSSDGYNANEKLCGEKYAFLKNKATEFYPQSNQLMHWSAQDCMTLDGIPYIGRFSLSKPNLYVATGFGKWGMTSSMVASEIISDMITGVKNPYETVFSPQRFNPAASAKTFLNNSAQTVKSLSKTLFYSPDKKIDALPNGHGGIIKYKGKKMGAYKDENGEIYLVSVRCPHLGCQLEWNPDEKSWECPCHGSRFDYKGNLLNNPAQNNLKSKKI